MSETSKLDPNEKNDEWPNIIRSRDELDSALEAGLKSGESELSGREIVDRALARVRDGKV